MFNLCCCCIYMHSHHRECILTKGLIYRSKFSVDSIGNYKQIFSHFWRHYCLSILEFNVNKPLYWDQLLRFDWKNWLRMKLDWLEDRIDPKGSVQSRLNYHLQSNRFLMNKYTFCYYVKATLSHYISI